MTVLRAARVFGRADATWVKIDGAIIAEVGTGSAPSGAEDLGDVTLAPGYIDLQINGIGDVDFSRCDADDFRRAEQRLLTHGVTTFLPTLISAPMDTYAPAVERLVEGGAFGVHLEGPFLGGAPGAHRPEYLRDADPRFVLELGGAIRMVTVAPERDSSFAFTSALSRAGVLVSVGHSTATFEDVRAAANAGARAVTHLFNAMSPLHQREPGVVGAALDDDRLTPTLIADLVHVHPAALRLAAASKRNVALVSDAIAIDAEWAASRGVREVDGAPRLEDGTLAGSILTMDRAVQNMVSIGVEADRAIEMASVIPSELLGIQAYRGIEDGARADVIALAGDLSVRAVWKDGERRV